VAMAVRYGRAWLPPLVVLVVLVVLGVLGVGGTPPKADSKPLMPKAPSEEERAQMPVVAQGSLGDSSSKTALSEADAIKSYAMHFAVKRAEQVKLAEDLWAKPEWTVRYRLVKVALDELFRTLRRAQRNLTGVDLAALPAVPVANASILEHLVLTWENTALFGDLALRLPDIVHSLVDTHKVRMEVLAWALELCLASPAFPETHRRQLELTQQEMSLVAADPNYINPFRERDIDAAQVRSCASKQESCTSKHAQTHTQKKKKMVSLFFSVRSGNRRL
jgi:hypothetical protein